MAKWATLTDDFPGPSWSGLWFAPGYGTLITPSGGKASWAAGSTYSGIGSNYNDMVDSSVLVKQNVGQGSGFGGGGLYLKGAGNVGICWIGYQFNALYGRIRNDNWGGSLTEVSIAWANTTDVWTRIRHNSGTGLMYLEYSTDGLSWSTLASAAPTASMLAQLPSCNIELQVFETLLTAHEFSKFNLAPSATSVTPSRVNATTSIPAPTPKTTVSFVPVRIEAVASIPAPSPVSIVSVIPARLNATTSVFLPNLRADTVLPARIVATTTFFGPTVAIDTSFVPPRINAVTSFFAPTLVATRLSTATPRFENPAPENDGMMWVYSDTQGKSILVSPSFVADDILAVGGQTPSEAPAPLGIFGANVGTLGVAARADHVHAVNAPVYLASPGDYIYGAQLGAAFSPAEAREYCVPVILRSATVIDALMASVVVAGTSGCLVRYALRGFNPSDEARPGVLIVDSGTVSATAGTGPRVATVAQQVLDSGIYWVSVVIQGGAGTRSTLASQVSPAVAAPGPNATTAGYQGVYRDGVTGAIPTNLDTPDGFNLLTAAPWVALRRAA